ncbi:F0F1 ATP synthase subunit B [Oscillatoria sp. FACHB-1407]|uniref:F0F1 ATP synthase subunit B n=1 Tax=Oscillatoria sp. FACHB-1407 TaxID=2692847 RepID=UPI0016829847|nr:F0F1 ATP synthase subunit B [Oscillatoria sp. FACHB-1407]MBD2462124.1 F0F1 ATP synthase subunit B [Oscillatoria sp. FACHB-1407]
MQTVLLLAVEAASEISEAAEGGGFGINSDILETNLINLLIIIGVLIYFGRGFLGKTLGDRRAKIEAAIEDAEKRKKEAAAALADQQQKLAQAQAEANRIRAAAEESAKAARASILAQAEQDIERMRATAAQDLTSQQERVIRELRQRVVALAMQQVEQRLQSGLNPEAQQQLIDRSIAMLGGAQ